MMMLDQIIFQINWEPFLCQLKNIMGLKSSIKMLIIFHVNANNISF